MVDEQKRARSSKLTGGRGFTYEDLVVTYYLAALLREEFALGTRGQVVRVAVQQNRQGEPMDDLVVDAEEAGERSRLSLQVKSKIVIRKNDAEFKEIIAEAVATRKGPDFKIGRDRYGLLAETVAVGRFDGLNNIIRRAVASTNGAEFASRFAPRGESSADDIKLRDDLQTLIQAKDDDEEWDFYRHFVAYRFDNLDPGGDRYASLANQLGEISTSGGPNFLEVLARHVRAGEGTARVWNRNSLIQEMRSLVRLRIAPSYVPDLKIVTDLARDAVADIRDDIAGISVDRPTFVQAADDASQKHVMTNISGLPGCGKSVVLRRCVEQALATGPVIFLKSDRLEGASWRSFANHHGLSHLAPAPLLGEIGGAGTPTLFIDGLDRVRPENRGIVTDLLRAIEREPELAHWRVLVTSRDQGLEVLRSWIPASLYSKKGLGNVDVGTLTDDEATALAEQRPALQPLLFGATAVQEIARRPFFAAVLADQASNLGFDKGPPQTETELIEAWWRAGGYNVEPEAADRRQRAMLDLAEQGAASLGKEIPGRAIAQGTVDQLASLRRDKIVDSVEAGTTYKFNHDIFFEWAFFRLLIDKRDKWPDALVAAGEPPLLARIVGLLSQREYEQGLAWDSTFDSLSLLPLRPQWRRAWLLGPAASGRFLEKRASFEGLVSRDEFSLLDKFLVWFQAERTIPSPLILQNPRPGVESSLLVRAADMLGWPSDAPMWQRVLLWVCARHMDFPARSLPHVVELFGVWQNMCADFPNGISARLIAVCDEWLIDLETKDSSRWEGLKGDTRDSLAGQLRKLILRAARSYPEPAGRALDRMMTWEKRSAAILKSVFGLSIVLAQTFPEKLAELVRLEVLDELPKDERDRKESERKAYYARLKAVRDKPEAERTTGEKRLIASPSMFHAIGNDRYDYNHIGVDRGNTLFYPPAPSHEPFDALFQQAPDVARSLVRDIANHAMTGWRQIHEINRREYGTLIPIDIDFSWGRQTFWGNQRSYSWYFGEGGPQPVEAAFLALMQWAHKRLDEGADLNELIQQVTEGHEGVAALGLAVSLAIERDERSLATRALLKSQRLWVYDFVRQVQEGTRGINLFGFDPKAQMTPQQQQGDAYLKGRNYRQRSLKDLCYLYALSNDEVERTSFMADIASFPKDLPYDVEEERGHPATDAKLRERAEAWVQFANKDNYGLAKVPGVENALQVIYRDPTSRTETRKLELEENAHSLREFSVVTWATESLSKGLVDPRLAIGPTVAFARMRDDPSLLLKIEESGSGMKQAAVVACAAVVIRFGGSTEEVEWAWSIIDRTEGASEEDGLLRYAPNSFDPRGFYMAALKADLDTGSQKPLSAQRLLTMAANPNPNISQTAFSGLLDAGRLPEQLVWNAAVLASELFASHFPTPTSEEDKGKDAQLHREAALARSIARLGTEPVGLTFVAPPAAWVRQSDAPRGRVKRNQADEAWTYPTFDFDPQFAAEVVKRFPVEEWVQQAQRRDQLLAYVAQLVTWTAERMFPSFADDDEDRSSQLYEWLNALAKLVARVIVHVPDDEAALSLIDPITRHSRRDVVQFLDDLTDQITRRHIYDAKVLPGRALKVLDHLMKRMLQEQDFSPTGYRPGEIRDHHLDTMLRSFLLVSAKDCPGAARFANGQWDDLPELLPQVSRIMAAAGWADAVMDKFLTLSERAVDVLPIEEFERIVSSSMDAEGFRLERWNAAGIPASISGAIQGLANSNHPLTRQQARGLLVILDRLVDIGDRRAAALQQSEHFRGIQVHAPHKEMA